MARLIPEPAFDPRRPLKCRRPFVANGRHYQPGDAFSWRKSAITPRQAMLLFRAGKVWHTDDVTEDDLPEPAVAPVTPEQPEQPVPSIPDAPEQPEQPSTDLDAIDDMPTLRAIAKAEGAPFKVSREAQKQAIRDHRNGRSDG